MIARSCLERLCLRMTWSRRDLSASFSVMFSNLRHWIGSLWALLTAFRPRIMLQIRVMLLHIVFTSFLFDPATEYCVLSLSTCSSPDFCVQFAVVFGDTLIGTQLLDTHITLPYCRFGRIFGDILPGRRLTRHSVRYFEPLRSSRPNYHVTRGAAL